MLIFDGSMVTFASYWIFMISVFPGSFDPFTIGHYDVLRSTLEFSDKVVIAVGYNHQKKGFFTLEQRMEIIADSIAPLLAEGAGIEVVSYSSLTVDFCRSIGAKLIVRGVRSSSDFENETVIASANRKLCPEIRTVFIPADSSHSFISSTVVRDVLINGGDSSIFLCDGVDITKYMK